MKPFAERNLVVTAIVGLTVTAAVSVAGYYADHLPLIGGGTEYSADFSDAANLQEGDDVRVAGVKVGAVDSISLSGAHVHIGFTVEDAWVGDATTVSIQIKTTLGQEYLALDPLGSHAQDPDRTIPRKRTSTPFDVTAAISDLAATAGTIDTHQLSQSFDVLAAAFSGTPPSVRSALNGLSRLSLTISQQDARITALAAQTNAFTGTLARSNQQFARLIDDGAVLLQALRARSAAITELLRGTRSLAEQLSGLVHDDEKLLGPALTQLGRVTGILVANQGHLRTALNLLGPYYTLLNNAAGSGPWIDIYICGLFGANTTPILDPGALRNCAPKRGTP